MVGLPTFFSIESTLHIGSQILFIFDEESAHEVRVVKKSYERL